MYHTTSSSPSAPDFFLDLPLDLASGSSSSVAFFLYFEDLEAGFSSASSSSSAVAAVDFFFDDFVDFVAGFSSSSLSSSAVLDFFLDFVAGFEGFSSSGELSASEPSDEDSFLLFLAAFFLSLQK